MNIPPIERTKSLTNLTYDHLRELILSRTLNPGQKVTEVWLAEQLGVSRTPVRHAVLKLSSEGLMTSDNGQIQVRRISIDEARDIGELRVAIEGYTARTLATRGIPDDSMIDLRQMVVELATFVDASGECTNNSMFMQNNRDFHRRLAEETGNVLLVAETERILDLVVLSGLLALGTSRRALSVIKEHNSLLDAIEDRNPDLAYEAAKMHASGFQSAFPEVYTQEVGSNSLPATKGDE